MNLEKIEKHYPKVSYYRCHQELNLREWQYALRKKFAEKAGFRIENTGSHPVFSDFLVNNPELNSQYKVSIRDNKNSMNYCSCYDFKTNNLGTCKHIEAVLLTLNQDKRKKALLTKEYLPPYTSIYLDYRDQRSVKIRVGSENHAEFSALKSKYFDKEGKLAESRLSDLFQIIREAYSISDSFVCYPDIISKVVDHLDEQRRNQLIENKYASNGGLETLVSADMFAYQKEGVLFAANKGRCLIADDMGLGKTLQAICTAELMKKEMGITKALIICPTSLKYQWKSEIQKFTNESSTVIEGLPHIRAQQYFSEDFYCIVSYHTAINDIKIIEKLLPGVVILDEAQRIKNFKTKVSRTIKRIPSDYALVLTGTPLENKLEELYSIVQFIDPFLLGPYHEFMANHRITDEAGKVTGYKNLHEISAKLEKIMIRRTRKEVLTQLPERTNKTLFVPLTKEQQEQHDEFQETVSRLVFKWRRMGFLSEKDRQRLLINLNMMRMVSDSTYILDQQSRHDNKVAEVMAIVEEIDASGTNKVVIFSQWERMTRLIAQELDQRGIGYEYLHGGIASRKREELFTNFNNKPEVKVFLSTDAGGIGLNLQAASYLINIDIPWNPAVLEQRVGRIHRLGQKNKVTIINMVSLGSIEERILGLLRFKSNLAEGILDQGEDVIFMEESKLKGFMNSVEELVQTNIESISSSQDYEEEDEEANEITATKQQQLSLFDVGFGDEDNNTEEGIKVQAASVFEEKEDDKSEPEENLLSQGIKLLGRLAETLSDKKATENLIASITEKDTETGKTYLKIPVENEKTVENALTLIGNLLKSFK